MTTLIMRRAALVGFVLGTLIRLVEPASASAGNWPGWRGAERNGVAADGDVLPIRWSSSEGVAWSRPLPGRGISSPIIWDERVFVTASDGPKLDELHVIAMSRSTGELLWHRRFWGTAPTRYHSRKSSMASPAPVTDGKTVFAFFGTGDVVALRCRDGGLLWHRSLASEYGPFENRFAMSSSPLLYGNLLLLQCDHWGDSYLLAIDKQTGANRWKTDRPGYWLSWASPQLVTSRDGGETELIVCGSEKIEGFDPQTGKRLWWVRGMQRECIPTPVTAGGLIYAVSGPSGDSMAIRPGGRGDVTETHVLWRNNRGAPFVPSAIVAAGLYYLVNDQGILTCLDTADGRRVWQKRLSGAYTASPVADAEHILFVNEEGTGVIIEAGSRSYREVARNEIGEPVYATPAIAGDALFLRTSQRLWCLDGH